MYYFDYKGLFLDHKCLVVFHWISIEAKERETFIFIGMIKSMHILHYEYLQTKKFEVFVDRFLLDIEYHRLIGQIHPLVP